MVSELEECARPNGSIVTGIATMKNQGERAREDFLNILTRSSFDSYSSVSVAEAWVLAWFDVGAGGRVAI
jgi:hypothetical protein